MMKHAAIAAAVILVGLGAAGCQDQRNDTPVAAVLSDDGSATRADNTAAQPSPTSPSARPPHPTAPSARPPLPTSATPRTPTTRSVQFVILGSGTIINVSTSPGTPTVPLGTPLPWRYAMNVDSSRSILFVAGAISGSGGRCQIIVDGVVVTDEPAINNAVTCSWNAP